MDWFLKAVGKGVTIFLIDNIDYPLSPSSSSSSSRSNSYSNPSYLLLFFQQYLNELPFEKEDIHNFKIFATCTSVSIDPRLLLPTNTFIAHIERPNDHQREVVLKFLVPSEIEKGSQTKSASHNITSSDSIDNNDQSMWNSLISQTKGLSISDLILMTRNAYHDSIIISTDKTNDIDVNIYLRNLFKYAPTSELRPNKEASDTSKQINNQIYKSELIGVSHICDYIHNIIFSRDLLSSLPDSEKCYLSGLEIPSPSGIIIHGPPGSGKSSLASEIAHMCRNKYRCLTLSCTDLVHKIVGESEQALVQAFTLARDMAPCLLVLDNIDIILGSPVKEEEDEEDGVDNDDGDGDDVSDSDSSSSSGIDERSTVHPGDNITTNTNTNTNSSSSDNIKDDKDLKLNSWQSRQRTRAPAIDRLLSTLLVEMDGLKIIPPSGVQNENNTTKNTTTKTISSSISINNDSALTQEVLVIATATRIDSLDKSLLRPGRLEEHIELFLPTSSQRSDFFKLHFPSATEEDLQCMINITENNTFATLRNVITEAGMNIMRKYLTSISMTSTDINYEAGLVDLQASYQDNFKSEVLNILSIHT